VGDLARHRRVQGDFAFGLGVLQKRVPPLLSLQPFVLLELRGTAVGPRARRWCRRRSAASDESQCEADGADEKTVSKCHVPRVLTLQCPPAPGAPDFGAVLTVGRWAERPLRSLDLL